MGDTLSAMPVTVADYAEYAVHTPVEELLNGWYTQATITFLLLGAVGYTYYKFHSTIFTFLGQMWKMVGLVLVIAVVASTLWKPEVLCGSEIDFKILSALREQGTEVVWQWVGPWWDSANATTTKTQILKAIQKNRGL